MNLTELARILKITPFELRETLPKIGFDIGFKAIKVDNRTARRIIKEWPRLIKRLRLSEQSAQAQALEDSEEEKEKKVITIPEFITVRDLSTVANTPVSAILKELMKNGIFSSMNECIDFETANIIGEDLNLEVKLKSSTADEASKLAHQDQGKKMEKILDKEKNLELRAPVMVVMGHVDHGKTRLLDAIRNTNVVDDEAGGITQHIGAYQIERKNKKITFIDTPGHEAFTAMRSRGAKIADIAILVVAADDGVKPQTIEAFRIIEAAKIPFVVAINKIDKESADIEKTKQELSNKLKIVPEDWGGKTICMPISAKAGTGVEELLDMILLIADLEEKNMQANPVAQAAGTVIESHIDKGTGPIATILIQNGTLRVGDQLCFAGNIYGKARALKNYKGENISSAGPSVPVQIIGFKIAPAVGDIVEVGEGERIKRLKNKNITKDSQMISKNDNAEEDDRTKLNLIIKSDVLGSGEAIEESLEKISTLKTAIKVIHKGLGNITEGDVLKAESSKAQIVGFNIKLPPQIENLIREKNIKVKTFTIIYDLIDHAKEELKNIFVPDIVRVNLGRIVVKAIFHTTKKAQIIGGKVKGSKIENNTRVEVLREEQIITQGQVVRLQAGKQDVREIEPGEECGAEFLGQSIIEEGDELQFFKEEEVLDN